MTLYVSGFSGRFPSSNNLDELWKNLTNGIDCVTNHENRWPLNKFKTPEGMGVLSQEIIERFDNIFFSISHKQAHALDPQIRILLEVVYEAICDSGINPDQLRGSRTGVFVGACSFDSFMNSSQDPQSTADYMNTGNCATMISNLLSYTFDFKASSMTIDTACSSSLSALHMAQRALLRGDCDYAIVGGVSLLLRPSISVSFNALQMLSPDGRCKTFDELANGYVRSEGIGAIFVTTSSAPLRFRRYAELVDVETNHIGNTKQGITYPSTDSQIACSKALYERSGINPLDVEYVEVHGTGTSAGDPVEIAAVNAVYCSPEFPRKSPLLIGSIKSNIGHCEGASGIASIIKAILIYKFRKIPPNIHFNKPNPNLSPILNKTMQVVDELTDFEGKYISVCNYGFGGTNGAALFSRVDPACSLISDKVPNTASANIHSPIIFLSGRTQEGMDKKIQYILNILLHSPLHQHHSLSSFLSNINTMPVARYRGSISLSTLKAHPVKSIDVNLDQRPIYFIFSGMGGNWYKMGLGLYNSIEYPSFRESLDLSNRILMEKFNFPFIDRLYRNEDTVISEDKLLASTSIVCLQIAFIDVLSSFGVQPSYIVAHSVGEVAGSYCAGAITRTQAVSIAYLRGKSFIEAQCPRGAMISAGVNWDELTDETLPGKIFKACYNSRSNCTLSGECGAIQKYSELLKTKEIFVRSVNSNGFAFHSPMIHEAATVLIDLIKSHGLFDNEPCRTLPARFLSTTLSINEFQAHKQSNYQLFKADAEYYANNMTRPVLFQPQACSIPSNAICIEIGPSALLRALIKQNQPSKELIYLPCLNSMAKEEQQIEDMNSLFQTIWSKGINFLQNRINNGLQRFEFDDLAVSALFGSSNCDWDHSVQFNVNYWKNIEQNDRLQLREDEDLASYTPNEIIGTSTHAHGVVWKIDLHSSEWAVFKDHKLRKNIVLPGAGYLIKVWSLNDPTFQNQVEFQDVTFLKAFIIDENVTTKLHVCFTLPYELLSKDEFHEFQIYDPESEELCVTGKVCWNRPVSENAFLLDQQTNNRRNYHTDLLSKDGIFMDDSSTVQAMSCKEIYEDLFPSMDFNFTNRFRSIHCLSSDGEFALLNLSSSNTTTEWIIRADALLQCYAFFTHDMLTNCATLPQSFGSMQLKPCEPSALAKYRNIDESNNTLFDIKAPAYISSYAKRTESFFGIAQNITFFTIKPQMPSTNPRINYIEEEIYRPIKVREFVHPDLKEYSSMFNDCMKHGKLDRMNLFNDTISGGFVAYFNDTNPQQCVTDPLLEHLLAMSIQQLRSVFLVSQFNRSSMAWAELFISIDSKHFISSPSCVSVRRMLEETWFSIDNDKHYLDRSGEDFLSSTVDLLVLVVLNENILQECLQSVQQCIDEDGFLLLVLNSSLCQDGVISELGNVGLNILIENSNDSFSVYICKKQVNASNIIQFPIYKRFEESYINKLKNLLIQPDVDQIWIIGSLSTMPGLIGFVKSLIKESTKPTKIKGFLFETDDDIRKIDLLFPRKTVNLLPWYFIRSSGEIMFPFSVISADLPYVSSSDVKLLTEIPLMNPASAVTSISPHEQWIQIPACVTQDDRYCAIHYTALNFRDVMLATGQLGDKASLMEEIGEFSGVRLKDQKRIAGVSKYFAAKYSYKPLMEIELPDNWSLEDGASVIIAYCTAYYALIIRGKLHQNESILIHSAGGALGFAAIRVALSLNCTIFATVGSAARRRFLLETFPQLRPSNIFDSRHPMANFEPELIHATKGKGVDMVLNSLAGPKLLASTRCLAKHGRFIEVGKFDLFENSALRMAPFIGDKSFIVVAADTLLHQAAIDDYLQIEFNKPDLTSCQIERNTMLHLFQEGLKNGTVAPLPTQVHELSLSTFSQVLRKLTKDDHVGKTLLKHSTCDIAESIENPRIYFNSKELLVISGGLGGYGFELLKLLIQRGGRNFLIVARRSRPSGKQEFLFHLWRQLYNINIHIEYIDFIAKPDYETVKTDIITRMTLSIAKFLLNDPSIGLSGIFHLGAVLNDGLFNSMSIKQWSDTINNKLLMAECFDEVARTHRNTVKHFVMFSSITSLIGNIGQSNYAYANSGLDQLCRQRHSERLPALSIQWGALGQVGMAARLNAEGKTVDIRGVQSLSYAMSIFERLLNISGNSHSPVIASYAIAENETIQSSLPSGDDSSEITEKISQILGFSNFQDMNFDLTFTQLGADSLMASEIRKVLKSVNIKYSSVELMNTTIKSILEKLESSAVSSKPLKPQSSLNNVNESKVGSNLQPTTYRANIPHASISIGSSVKARATSSNSASDSSSADRHQLNVIEMGVREIRNMLALIMTKQ